MNSFYVPQLAGQIYAMAGMQTRLQLLADQPGKFVGRNSQYSGGGFSDQHFEVLATEPGRLRRLGGARPSRRRPSSMPRPTRRWPPRAARNPITYYSAIEPKLFDSIIAKYTAISGQPRTCRAAPRR